MARSSPKTAGRIACRSLAPLSWDEGCTRLQRAAVRGGVYVLVSDGLDQWTAQWRPAGGRMKCLLFRQTATLARQACERHRIEVETNALLERGGAADLTRPDMAGPALAWKRR